MGGRLSSIPNTSVLTSTLARPIWIVGDLAKAEGHLATLQEICASCEETEELAEAIAQFKEGGAAQ